MIVLISKNDRLNNFQVVVSVLIMYAVKEEHLKILEKLGKLGNSVS